MLAAASSSHTDTPKVNPKAMGWAIGVHVLLLLIFFFWRYQMPADPLPLDEMGMEVNIGTSADGFGEAQPLELGDPAPMDIPSYAAQSGAYATETGFDADGDEVVRASPVTAPNRDRRQENRQQQTQRRQANTNRTNSSTAAPAPQQPKFVYQGATGPGGNKAAQQLPGGAEGNTHGDGDRGVPGGTPGASNYEGTPGRGGVGYGHNLSGRTMVATPDKSAEFRHGGTVTLKVKVKPDGTIESVISAKPGAGELYNIAMQKVKQIRFSKVASDDPRQYGDITFSFKAQRR